MNCNLFAVSCSALVFMRSLQRILKSLIVFVGIIPGSIGIPLILLFSLLLKGAVIFFFLFGGNKHACKV